MQPLSEIEVGCIMAADAGYDPELYMHARKTESHDFAMKFCAYVDDWGGKLINGRIYITNE